MSLSPRPSRLLAAAATRPAWPVWLGVGVAGWAWVVALGAQLYSTLPRQAGFDLELLLTAGRRVARGSSPYDAAMLAGQTPSAVDLFYSYPPPVAQYLSLFAGVPSALMLIAWAVGAAAGLAIAAMALARQSDVGRAPRFSTTLSTVGLPVLALAPFVFPFTIATLFGNLDALFPLLYGLMLLGALGSGMPSRFAGGVGLALAAVAKLHPASMGVWFIVRGVRERRIRAQATAAAAAARYPRSGPLVARSAAVPVPGPWLVLGAAVAIALMILAVSLVAGGTGPWLDYLAVLRSASAADVVDPRNIAPAAQIALWTGGGESLARNLQVGVSILAIGGTASVAWFRDDTVESVAWATLGSLLVLPVTWFHYPVALIPVAIVAWLRAGAAARRQVAVLLAGAIAIAVAALVLPVVVWCSVGLVLIAVHQSRPNAAVNVPFPSLEPSRITRFPVPGSR